MITSKKGKLYQYCCPHHKSCHGSIWMCVEDIEVGDHIRHIENLRLICSTNDKCKVCYIDGSGSCCKWPIIFHFESEPNGSNFLEEL